MQRIKAATRPARAPPPFCALSLWRRRTCRFQLTIIIAGIQCRADTNHSQLELQAVDFAILHYLWSKAAALSVIAPYRGRHPQKIVFEPETPPFDPIMLESANSQHSRGRHPENCGRFWTFACSSYVRVSTSQGFHIQGRHRHKFSHDDEEDSK